MNEKATVWALAGPTASGKTALSVQVAARCGCEIVCMDSMQIYRGMDVGTAKPTPAEMAGIPHHMMDVADPREPFSVAMYQEMAEKVMGDILARGHTPLLVGGTGFYLRALTNPMTMGMVPADDALRDELQALADGENGAQKLHDLLAEVDPVTAERLPLGDVRRMIRAYEVWKKTGIPFSNQPQTQRELPFRYRVAALTLDRAALYERCDARVDSMLGSGLVDEVRGLLASGVPADCQAMKGIGYKELTPVCLAGASLDAAVYTIKLNTRHYAKRQLTWFRHEDGLTWFDGLSAHAADALTAFYTEEDAE